EVQRAVTRGAAGTGRVPENLRRVVAGEFGPARRFAERSASWPDGNPRVTIDHNILDRDDESVALAGAVEPDGAADRVGQRRTFSEAGPACGDGLVLGRLEVAGASVVGLDLETLAAADAQQRFVFPVEGVLAALFSGDALHGGPLASLFRR